MEKEIYSRIDDFISISKDFINEENELRVALGILLDELKEENVQAQPQSKERTLKTSTISQLWSLIQTIDNISLGEAFASAKEFRAKLDKNKCDSYKLYCSIYAHVQNFQSRAYMLNVECDNLVVKIIEYEREKTHIKLHLNVAKRFTRNLAVYIRQIDNLANALKKFQDILEPTAPIKYHWDI